MANLRTLDGISDAREKLYNQLETGQLDDKRAMAQERVLRGQTELKATIPLRLVSIIAKAHNPKVQEYAEPVLRAIHKFVTGTELAQIGEQRTRVVEGVGAPIEKTPSIEPCRIEESIR